MTINEIPNSVITIKNCFKIGVVYTSLYNFINYIKSNIMYIASNVNEANCKNCKCQ